MVGQHDWTGSTSGEEMGFDPLVVPTLVDNLKKRVVAESKTIMNYLDQEIPTPPLYPTGCTELVEKHVKLVDDTPHAGLLYGGDPDRDTRPAYLRNISYITSAKIFYSQSPSSCANICITITILWQLSQFTRFRIGPKPSGIILPS